MNDYVEERTDGRAGELPEEALEAPRRRRFDERVRRVLAAMQAARIDWRGIPFTTPDGRIGVRVAPVEGGQRWPEPS